MSKMVLVHWYACNCDEVAWRTKYCDEHHRASASIPAEVLEQHR